MFELYTTVILQGTKATRGITLDLSKIEDLYLSPRVFARMPKLKFLQIYSSISKEQVLYLPKGLKSLPIELRSLHWDGYPLKSLPSTFSAEKLVTLEMRNSQVRKLWHGTQVNNIGIFCLNSFVIQLDGL